MKISDYMAQNDMTYKQVYKLIKNGKIYAKKRKGVWIIGEMQPVGSVINRGPGVVATALDIKIKQQKLEQEEIKTKKLKGELFSLAQVIEMLENIHEIVCEECKPTMKELIANAKSK